MEQIPATRKVGYILPSHGDASTTPTSPGHTPIAAWNYGAFAHLVEERDYPRLQHMAVALEQLPVNVSRTDYFEADLAFLAEFLP